MRDKDPEFSLHRHSVLARTHARTPMPTQSCDNASKRSAHMLHLLVISCARQNVVHVHTVGEFPNMMPNYDRIGYNYYIFHMSGKYGRARPSKEEKIETVANSTTKIFNPPAA